MTLLCRSLVVAVALVAGRAFSQTQPAPTPLPIVVEVPASTAAPADATGLPTSLPASPFPPGPGPSPTPAVSATPEATPTPAMAATPLPTAEPVAPPPPTAPAEVAKPAPLPAPYGQPNLSLELGALEYSWERQSARFEPQGSSRRSAVLDSGHHLGLARSPLTLNIADGLRTLHLTLWPSEGGFGVGVRGGVLWREFEFGGQVAMAELAWSSTDAPGTPEESSKARGWKLGPYAGWRREIEKFKVSARAFLGLTSLYEHSDNGSRKVTRHDGTGVVLALSAKSAYPVFPEILDAFCAWDLELGRMNDGRTVLASQRGRLASNQFFTRVTLAGLEIHFR